MLEAEAVWKEFDQPDERVVALRDVTLAVAEGEFVAVTGESGSGKSTLLSLLGAIDRPTRGEIRFRGEPLGAATPGRLAEIRLRRIGFVFQDFLLVRHLTVSENVMLPAALAAAEDPRGRADALLARVGMAHRAGHRPGDLSRGEMQRVALARALVNRPEVLIADEPTANLD
ncbi:MAG TPA: ABC transporter ATP-binding protein, partial [Candidatus Saccharimonadales bacterium]|nr:ABC transporter ATP-binding protein [Candidatus Saccharimonadales bacterium]